MTDSSKQFDRSVKLSSTIAKVLQRRAESALSEYREAVERIAKAQLEVAQAQWSYPLQFWNDGRSGRPSPLHLNCSIALCAIRA